MVQNPNQPGGYPPQPGGYPPQPGGYPPQPQPQYGQPQAYPPQQAAAAGYTPPDPMAMHYNDPKTAQVGAGTYINGNGEFIVDVESITWRPSQKDGGWVWANEFRIVESSRPDVGVGMTFSQIQGPVANWPHLQFRHIKNFAFACYDRKDVSKEECGALANNPSAPPRRMRLRTINTPKKDGSPFTIHDWSPYVDGSHVVATHPAWAGGAPAPPAAPPGYAPPPQQQHAPPAGYGQAPQPQPQQPAYAAPPAPPAAPPTYGGPAVQGPPQGPPQY